MACLPSGQMGLLEENGIVVSVEVSEEQLLSHWYNKSKYGMPTLHVMWVPTYDCNMRCKYCFEEHDNDQMVQKQDSVRISPSDVREWLDHVVTSGAIYRGLQLTLFGGEPMLEKRNCIEILSVFFDYARRGNMEMSASMITNGLALDSPTVKTMRSYGLNHIQVTIDGSRDAHDARRPDRSGGPTFDRIYGNVKKCVDEGLGNMFVIRVGYDRHNVADIGPLLDMMKKDSFPDYGVSAAPAPIVPTVANQEHCQNYNCTSSEMARYTPELVTTFMKYGYAIPETILPRQAGACGSVVSNFYVLDYLGNIYKCGGLVGLKDQVVGQVKPFSLNHRWIRNIERNLWAQCPGCAFAPLCGGGCRSDALAQTGDIDSRMCNRGLYSECLPRLLDVIYGH